METLTGKTLNIVEDNIRKLKEIFPEVFNEDKVDIEKLEEILGDYKDKNIERYNFTWPGKSKAIRIAQTPSTGTLRPCKKESKNWDTTQNLYIEGDNLEVLKLLQKSYYGQVKMIYIDPPYNTGNDFVYKDDFKDNLGNYLEITGQKDEDGNKITTNTESNGRYHSNWLNMMYPRLKLSRNLLSEDGVIFISIDDNEVSNLKKVCDEVFGEGNLVTQIPWQARQSIQNDTDLSSSHEYILSYAKNRRVEHRRLKESNEDKWYKLKSFACFPLPLDKEKFSNLDNDIRGPWKADPFDAPNIRPNLTYAIKNSNTGEEFWPPKGRCWRTDEKIFKELLKDNRIIFGKMGTSKPQLKVFYEEKKKFGSVDNTWFTGEKCGTSTQGTKILQGLFEGTSYFDTPKPIKLIKKLMQLSLGEKSQEIVLDFFSGSSTTAHATMQLNAEDGGNRKFIMVQLPEKCDEKSEAFKAEYKNICEIGKERIRRAGEKIKEDNKDKEGIDDLDIGFKVFKLDSSNINKWDSNYDEDLELNLLSNVENVKSDRTEEDVLYEILLKYGVDLNMPIEEYEIKGKKVFSIGFGAILVCLDKDITLEVVEAIGKLKDDLEPEFCRVVFMDNGFNSDSIKTNAVQILKRYGIEDVKSI
ncbi:site-specific DNA-methyltransferase [Clostridium tarantellae]|uniref:Site-specific DNA-methyltransferase n=1 Tax=Clostridium tarantellae TaxID=39493 RepID=A0A6I1MJ80_9CLOT|nr:site-specific DNA-methyltransferase [Clostridium tarantellae]MPQ43160.1 site-specific DNA-methyltransferase [Clostridium tarantellae]